MTNPFAWPKPFIQVFHAISLGSKERLWVAFSGLSVAMDGHSQAHMDVLVACPEKATHSRSAPTLAG